MYLSLIDFFPNLPHIVDPIRSRGGDTLVVKLNAPIDAQKKSSAGSLPHLFRRPFCTDRICAAH